MSDSQTAPLPIEGSDFFKRAFGAEAGRSTDNQALIVSLRKIRATASVLGDRVRKDFPGLTDHSVVHVVHIDALWFVTAQLLGDEHNLTANELYVLGCAFYLHDAALCFAAFETEDLPGREALRQTDERKDALGRLGRSYGITNPGAADDPQDGDAKNAQVMN